MNKVELLLGNLIFFASKPLHNSPNHITKKSIPKFCIFCFQPSGSGIVESFIEGFNYQSDVFQLLISKTQEPFISNFNPAQSMYFGSHAYQPSYS